MLDRIPTPGQEGRVLVTPENGSAPYYAKIQMADNPTQNGDPFAKFTMLHDAVAAAYDKNEKAVPNDIFAVLSRFHKGLGNEYVWAKTATGTVPAPTGTLSEVYLIYNTGNSFRLTLYDSVEVVNGVVVPNGSSSVVFSPENPPQASALMNKYFYVPNVNDNANRENVGKLVQFFAGSTVVGFANPESLLPWYVKVTNVLHIEVAKEATVVGFVNSPDSHAYPPVVDDGFTYTALGQIGNKVQIATGSYTGTGTFGSSNQTRLTFDFAPKLITFGLLGSDAMFATWIYPKQSGVAYYQSGGTYSVTKITWSGNTVSWYASDAMRQMNDSNTEYLYFAIG